MGHFVACSQCGTCVKACSQQGECIAMGDGGVVIDLDKCVVCGHCAAVCPTDEMENPLSPTCELILPLPEPEAMANHMRSVRSVKFYKEDLVPQAQLETLLDIGRYVQTGSNRQGISYLVLSGRDKLMELNHIFEEEALRLAQADDSLGWVAGIVKQQRETGRDILYRGASQLIFALADEDFPSGRANAQFSLTFIATLAPTMGLGTCWAGILESIAIHDDMSGKLREFLNLPKGKRIRGAMMVGVPDITFRRLVERKPLVVDWR